MGDRDVHSIAKVDRNTQKNLFTAVAGPCLADFHLKYRVLERMQPSRISTVL